MNVLLLDAYILIYRARSGYMKGDYPVVYNFFRGVRPLIEKFSPQKVYFVLEGNPQHRTQLNEAYKANRSNNDRHFHEQKAQIIDNCTIYNPVKKKIIEKPDYDYVTWKALRGDPTDNIRGIPGCGDKTADKLVRSQELITEYLSKDPVRQQIFERNVNLIRLVDFSDNLSEMERHDGVADFEQLYDIFDDMEFHSMLKEKTWNKYVNTFKEVI